LLQPRAVSAPTLDCSNTLMGLKDTTDRGEPCPYAFPPIDRELFGVYFDSFHRSGFLED
jgi:hypothetical protein